MGTEKALKSFGMGVIDFTALVICEIEAGKAFIGEGPWPKFDKLSLQLLFSSVMGELSLFRLGEKSLKPCSVGSL